MIRVTDPLEFGSSQLLTLAGLLLTTIIAGVSLKTFNRWKREKIEEKRIEVAVDALAIAYESKYVFDHIRGHLISFSEWSDMEKKPGETEEDRKRRGKIFATFRRIETHQEFFDRVWKLQPRCMAVLGPDTEEIFNLLHQSRKDIETGAEMLLSDDEDNYGVPEDTKEFYKQLRRDVWTHGTFEPEKDRVGKRLVQFRTELERICRPVIDREYARIAQSGEVLATAQEAVRLLEESRKKKKRDDWTI